VTANPRRLSARFALSAAARGTDATCLFMTGSSGGRAGGPRLSPRAARAGRGGDGRFGGGGGVHGISSADGVPRADTGAPASRPSTDRAAPCRIGSR